MASSGAGIAGGDRREAAAWMSGCAVSSSNVAGYSGSGGDENDDVFVERKKHIWHENNGKKIDKRIGVSPICIVASQLHKTGATVGYRLSVNPVTKFISQFMIKDFYRDIIALEDLSHLSCQSCGESFSYTHGTAFPIPEKKVDKDKYLISDVLVHNLSCALRYIKDRANKSLSGMGTLSYNMAKDLFGFEGKAEIAPPVNMLKRYKGPTGMSPEEYITDTPAWKIAEAAPFMVPPLVILQCMETLWNKVPVDTMVFERETIFRPKDLRRPANIGSQPIVQTAFQKNPTIYDAFLNAYQSSSTAMYNASVMSTICADISNTTLVEGAAIDDENDGEEADFDDEDEEDFDEGAGGGAGGGGGGGGDMFD